MIKPRYTRPYAQTLRCILYMIIKSMHSIIRRVQMSFFLSLSFSISFNFTQPTHYVTITTRRNSTDTTDSPDVERVHLKKLVGQLKNNLYNVSVLSEPDLEMITNMDPNSVADITGKDFIEQLKEVSGRLAGDKSIACVLLGFISWTTFHTYRIISIVVLVRAYIFTCFALLAFPSFVLSSPRRTRFALMQQPELVLMNFTRS